MTIPASQIVQVNPGVLSAGGSALVLNGLVLSADAALAPGVVAPFADASSVSKFFGATSPEAAIANVYFRGYDNATLLPGNLIFARYNAAASSAFLRSGSLAGMTLAQLQALTGTLIITVDGTVKTSSAINLTGAASFSAAAALIQAAFTTPGFVVTYDSQRAAFLFTDASTGATSTLTYATGTLATGLSLTQATGAVLAQGAVAAVPATFMENIVAQTQNWAAFMTTFEPILADKLLFAAWTVSKSNRYVYAAWDTDVNAIVAGNQTAFGPLALAGTMSGVVPVYKDPLKAAFILGITASTDFTRTNGRLTYAFKHLAGLVADVTDPTVAQTLIANGYNFYGAYATANQNFIFLYPGLMAGQYLWIDPFVNQVWLNNALQLAILSLMTSIGSIPYNPQGYALIDAACMDPILAGLNFGAIRNNVPLSQSQAAQVDNAAGAVISPVLAARGWYLQIREATAQVRAARGSPPCTFWYMDGGAVQKVVLASILVQ